jgi:hypothetical protein
MDESNLTLEALKKTLENLPPREPRSWRIWMTYAYMWLNVGPFDTEEEAIEAWKQLPERRGREVRPWHERDEPDMEPPIAKRITE